MAVYLKTGFTTANATLTNVFTSVTEDDASVTFRADATGGTFGLEGSAVTWSGSPPTADSAYGTIVFANTAPPIINQNAKNRPTQLRIGFQIAWTSISGFTTNDRLKIIQVMCNNELGAEIELCSISFKKTASAYQWRIDTFDGTSTTGGTFSPSGFAYSTFQGWCVDIIMKPDVGHVNIGTVWGWDNQGLTGSHVQHAFGTTSFFAPESTSHIPTKVNFGAVAAVNGSGTPIVPSAASELNFDDISIVDNLMANPGLIRPNGMSIASLIGRDAMLACSLECDYAQVGLPFQKYAVFGAPPSANITLGDTDVTTSIAVDEGACYMIATTMVESIIPNADNPASRDDPNAYKGAYMGRGYTQIYTEKYNADSTSLPSVPYWGMAQPITPKTFIVVPPGHNQIVLYNGEFVEMEVYIHRVRFPY